MKTKGVRLYGKNDVRYEEFDLPPLKDDEILVKVISDSICMSSWKTVQMGEDHRRTPNDLSKEPVLLGHETAGEILEVGAKHRDKFKPGQKFALQPALGLDWSPANPGYSYSFCGGGSQYAIMPAEVMDTGSLLEYNGEGFFAASLAEPISCIISAYKSMYHNVPGKYEHIMGIKKGGKKAILAGCGPMGLGAIDYTIGGPVKPSLLVVTDVDQARIDRAASIFTKEYAQKRGVEIHFVNTSKMENSVAALRELTGGTGFDDVSVFAPVPALVEEADKIIGHDGCINFFAGPANKDFEATVNFYNVHYTSSHFIGTTGANTDDMKDALELTAKGEINPACMITHIGGLDVYAETTCNLPKLDGGKKLVYTHLELPLTAIEDFGKLGESDPRFKVLDEICGRNNGLWNPEAEKYLLENF